MEEAYQLIRYSYLSDYGIKKKTGVHEGELQVLKELVMQDIERGSLEEKIIASLRAKESIKKDIRMQIARRLEEMGFEKGEIAVICQLFPEELEYALNMKNSFSSQPAIVPENYQDEFSWSIAKEEFSRIQEILKGLDVEL